MPWRRILQLIVLGLLAGLLNGLLGAGGGIAVVLGLRRLLKDTRVDGHSVYATAIALMLPLSLLSATRYFKAAPLQDEKAILLIFPAIAGGILGAILLPRIKTAYLSRLFAAVVLLSGIIMVAS